MNINEYLEDYDNSELNDYEWNEQMEEAVGMYNEEYRTDWEPAKAIRKYKEWKHDKLFEE
jgi:hypothetical protein